MTFSLFSGILQLRYLLLEIRYIYKNASHDVQHSLISLGNHTFKKVAHFVITYYKMNKLKCKHSIVFVEK